MVRSSGGGFGGAGGGFGGEGGGGTEVPPLRHSWSGLPSVQAQVCTVETHWSAGVSGWVAR